MELMITPVIIGDRGMAPPLFVDTHYLSYLLPFYPYRILIQITSPIFPLYLKTRVRITSPDLTSQQRGGRMETGEMNGKYMKVEVPSSETETIISPPGGGLTRQGSLAKSNCLCSPTTHSGSFRCRLHRAPTLQRTKSIDSHSKPAESNSETS